MDMDMEESSDLQCPIMLSDRQMAQSDGRHLERELMKMQSFVRGTTKVLKRNIEEERKERKKERE